MDARPDDSTASARRIADLTPGALAAALRRDPRLLLPVGALVVRWPALPVGAATVIVDHLADDLSARCDVLRAPTLNYGTATPDAAAAPGATSIRKKTLHRLLNDLLAEWEAHGVDEFVLVTAHRDDAHLEALATVITARARVRVVDALAVDCTDLLETSHGAARDADVATALLLHLAPGLVQFERPADAFTHRTPRAGSDAAPAHTPAHAPTADVGARIYQRVLSRVAERVLGAPVLRAGDERTRQHAVP